MATYVLVDASDSIINYVEWDGAERLNLPPGMNLIPWEGPWGRGWKWDYAKNQPIDPDEPLPDHLKAVFTNVPSNKKGFNVIG